MSPAEYGVFNIINYISLFFNLISGAGLGFSFVNFYFNYSHNEQRLQKFISSAFSFIFFFNLLILIFFCLIGSPLFNFLFNGNNIPFWPYGFYAALIGLFGNLSSSFFTFIRNKKHIQTFVALSLVGAIITVVSQLCLVLSFDLGINGLLIGKVLSTFMILMLMIYFYDVLKIKFSLIYLKRAFSYSTPLIGFNFLVWGLNHFDKFYLIKILSPQTLGIYTFLFTIGNIFYLLVTALGTAFQPLLFESFQQNDIIKAQKIQSIYPTLMAFIYCIFIAGIINLDIFFENTKYSGYTIEIIICMYGFSFGIFQYLFMLFPTYSKKKILVGSQNIIHGLIFILLLLLFQLTSLINIVIVFVLSRVISLPIQFYLSQLTKLPNIKIMETIFYPHVIIFVTTLIGLSTYYFNFNLSGAFFIIVLGSFLTYWLLKKQIGILNLNTILKK